MSCVLNQFVDGGEVTALNNPISKLCLAQMGLKQMYLYLLLAYAINYPMN